MEHQSNKCNSIGTNRTIGTNGRVEWIPTRAAGAPLLI